ncbi:UL16-binding protein 1-like [Molossus nigricans]
MARSCSPVLLCLLLLLLLLPTPAAPSCTMSLGYKFTITPTGQPWCEMQGQVNGNTFLTYTCCIEKVNLFNVQGMKLNASEAWNQQGVRLKTVMEEFRKKLLDIKTNNAIPIDPVFLQVSMTCEKNDNVFTNSFWNMGFNGTTSLHLDSKYKNWTVLRPEGTQLKNTLASDRAMTDLLVKTPTWDCREWLTHVFCAKDETLNTKAAVSKAARRTPITAIIPVSLACSIVIGIIAAPTTATATVRCKATAKMTFTAIILVILACSVTVGILCVSLQSQKMLLRSSWGCGLQLFTC